MSQRPRAEPQQLGLTGGAPAEKWLSMDEAMDVFKNAGAEETILLARVDIIRTRLSDRGYEFHPLDVLRWSQIEGVIAAGQQRRRKTDVPGATNGTPSGRSR